MHPGDGAAGPEVVRGVDSPTLRLVQPQRLTDSPTLDADQRSVVDHRGGLLLVLAGPGTGKTTTLVEAMVARLSGPDSLEPHQVVGLTFSKQAAADWRDRVALRVGGTAPNVSTFHSYAFAIVRKFPEFLHLQGGPRLLAGYEEQTVVTEVIQAALNLGRVDFPEQLRVAALTQEFGRQLRAVMARARSIGISGDGLLTLAHSAGDATWTLAATLLKTYEAFIEDSDAFDYASLVVAATAVAQHPEVTAHLHNQIRAVFVDEFQDTDPAQVQLLRTIVGPQCDLVVVGDPDQSIYTFRGADIRGILDFADDFATPDRPVRTLVLRECRRFGPKLRAVADVGLRRVNYAGTSSWAELRERHREPICSGPDDAEVATEILLCAEPRVETTAVADRMRRLHQSGAPYSSMAILVRNADQIASFVRACVVAGVPVDADGDELPVTANAAVAALLDALLVVENHQTITAAMAESLLRSPLCGVDPADLRAMTRHIRAQERASDHTIQPTPSADILRRLVDDASLLAQVPREIGRDSWTRIKQWHELLELARQTRRRGGSPQEVLWTLWAGGRSTWPQRLREQSLRGGSGGRRADRDVDAVTTLFEMAAKAGHTTAKTCARFVEEVRQHVIGIAPRASAQIHDRVRIMTAHRAKGLEWDHVFVCGLQESLWPNTRLRGGMLSADRLTRAGLGSGLVIGELLAEERRLFYVAVTRARRRLWLTAVSSDGAAADASRPSILLRELLDPESDEPRIAGVSLTRMAKRSVRTLSLTDVVATLRNVLLDHSASDAAKAAAAQELVRLQRIGGHSGAVAHPSSWWGLSQRTESDAPVRPDGPVKLSGSGLESLHACSLKWFLEREVAAQTPKTTALVYGTLVHTLCEHVAKATHDMSAADLDTLVDSVWSSVEYQAPWIAAQERAGLTTALTRFMNWHRSQATLGSKVCGFEYAFDVSFTITTNEGASHEVRLHGSMDRVEVTVDAEGMSHITVYDFKTNATPPSGAKVRDHIQLATSRFGRRYPRVAGCHGG